METKRTLVRITTVAISLEKLLSGQLRFMNSYYHVIGIAAERKNLEKLAKSEGIDVFPLEMTRKMTPLQDLKTVFQLYSYFKKTKPFIVHTHTPKAGIVGMLASRLAGVPHRLHTVAGLPLLEATGTKRRILNFVERLTYTCATKVYPNSKGLMEIIIQNRFCSKDKLTVLANGSSNGIDTAHFSPEHFSIGQNLELKRELSIHEKDFVFIFVGRLVKDKGMNELISAFTRLQAENKHLKLLLVGDYEADLDPLSGQTLKEIKTHPAIISTGFKYDVRPYFAISDVLVFPSYREGFPNGVLQAGAMGLPCIVSDINGCNEIISDTINGRIIPVKNEQALYSAMRSIVENVEAREDMRNNARRMIVSRYEQHVVWEAILEEYRKFDNPHQ
ncbi:MAG TPA: glycosyltransferase family 4 protein [Flavobacterium sp.]|jgi:glycosyltransferase involved in cell wall biosynthesis